MQNGRILDREGLKFDYATDPGFAADINVDSD